MTLTVGSLFSGIGGIDLGLERAGMRVLWQCEKDAYCRRVLARHWPDVPCYEDVTAVEWSEVEPVDLICGGFPCQPVSRAGRRLAQADERWLWPEVANAISHLRPRYALMENVPGLLVHGMGDVLGDLAELGYDAEWESIPAASVGAVHIRDRVFIVAYRQTATVEGTGRQWRMVAYTESGGQRSHQNNAYRPEECDLITVPVGSGEDVADSQGFAIGARLCASEPSTERRGPPRDSGGTVDVDNASSGRHGSPERAVFPRGTSPVVSTWWDTEPDVGRVADGIPRRVDRLRALGNAVVPQVAEWIGRRIVSAA